MKFRHGFVSNSSTSSFSIFGVALTERDVFEKLLGKKWEDTQNCCEHEFNRKECEFCSTCGSPSFKPADNYCNWDDVYDAAEEIGMSMQFLDRGGDNFDQDTYVIGRNLKGNGGKRAAMKDLDSLKALSTELKERFGEDAEFHSGEYSC
jgi:hypothetical protein